VAAGIAHDHSRTQKSNSRQDTLDDTAHGVLVGGQGAVGGPEHDNRGDGRTESHEGVSPQAGRLSVQLAVQAYNASDDQRRAESQNALFISA
jgi:hypothetical protein